MVRPYLSIIIPVHNREQYLISLLKSIVSSSFKNFEIIVVDDSSTDNILKITKTFKTTYLRTKQRKGAGFARNLGAGKAKGQIIVFIDSDVVLFENTLSELAKSFKDKKVNTLIGLYDKKPANPSLFTNFKALRDYSYIVLERDPALPIGGFGGWISAIKKNIFKQIGGFNTSYKGAGMEDYEFAWRLIKKTRIIFNPRVKIKHNFPDFRQTLRIFYIRSYLWIGLYLKYKKFFSSAANPKEAVIAGLANISTVLFMLLLIYWPVFILFILVFFLRLYLGRVFLIFSVKEKGFLFLIPVIIFSHILYLAVYLGVAKAYFEKLTQKIN